MNAIIILGGGLTSTLTLNEHTRQRFDAAQPILHQYNIIICSSDKSYRKLDEIRGTSEARVGKNYLEKQGVDPKKIYLEEKSRDTISNAYFCRKEIIDPFDVTEITIVTSKFHMQKTKEVFKLVFPVPNYTLTFIESPNGEVDKEQLRARTISEELITDFYKNELCKEYNIIPGDMNSIGKYITHHNPSFTGKKDEPHERLTKKIHKQISGTNPLY